MRTLHCIRSEKERETDRQTDRQRKRTSEGVQNHELIIILVYQNIYGTHLILGLNNEFIVNKLILKLMHITINFQLRYNQQTQNLSIIKKANIYASRGIHVANLIVYRFKDENVLKPT